MTINCTENMPAPIDFSDIDEITELDRQEMREIISEYAEQRLYRSYLAGEASNWISFEEYKSIRAEKDNENERFYRTMDDSVMDRDTQTLNWDERMEVQRIWNEY